MNRSTLLFVIALIVLGVAIAVGYVWWRTMDRSVEGTYSIADAFVDSTGPVVASVRFVRVSEYDSLSMLRIAEHLTRQSIEQQRVNNQRERDFLYHFFCDGDTAALTPAIIEELAYTHPNLTEPGARLLMVPGGWVIRATFAPGVLQPRSVVAKRSQFYMPRPGIRAMDLR